MCDQWIEKIPVVSEPAAVAIFILNVIFPGVGTMVLACMSPSGDVGDQLLVGILQLLLFTFCFVGIFWSIWWSVLVCQKAGHSQQQVQVQPGVYIPNQYPQNNYGNQYPPNNQIFVPSQPNNIYQNGNQHYNQPQYINQPAYNNQPIYNNQPLYTNQPQYNPVPPQYNNQPQYNIVQNIQHTNQPQYNPVPPQYNIVQNPQQTNQPQYNPVPPINQTAAVNFQQGTYMINNNPNAFEQK